MWDQPFPPQPNWRYGRHIGTSCHQLEQSPWWGCNLPKDPCHTIWLEKWETYVDQLWWQSFPCPIRWIRPTTASFQDWQRHLLVWDEEVSLEVREWHPWMSIDLQHWKMLEEVTCSMRLLKSETRMMTGVTWNKWAANFSTPDQIADVELLIVRKNRVANYVKYSASNLKKSFDFLENTQKKMQL